MDAINSRRKLIKHFHEPGDLHELTFSCYRRLPLLTNDEWRCRLARCIDEANLKESMQLVAFVFMPEHVHLLVSPKTRNAKRRPLLGTHQAAVFQIDQELSYCRKFAPHRKADRSGTARKDLLSILARGTRL